jgi:hypothetical protein
MHDLEDEYTGIAMNLRIFLPVGDRQKATKKPPAVQRAAFRMEAAQSAAYPINASRIALRDVLCADQLSYARLHGRHG